MAALDRLRGAPLLGLLTLGWGIMMRQFGARDIYPIVGSYALLVIALVLIAYRKEARGWLRGGVRAAAIGIGAGALMTALTYPIYRLSVALVPALEPIVADLYRTTHKGHWAVALAWVLVIVIAEELLFRGAFLAAFARREKSRAGLAVSVLSYAAAQACSGSLIVGLLALCCGTLWTFERERTGSLVAPLLSHMIWTPVVILLRPVAYPAVLVPLVCATIVD